MAVTATPIFTQVPNMGMARVAAANTARDGSGSLVTLFTAGTNGSRVEDITFTSAQASAAASSAMVGRVFVSDTGGTNYRLLREIAIVTITASNTVIGAVQTMTFVGGVILKSGQLLACTISVYAGAQDQMDVIARGGDY